MGLVSPAGLTIESISAPLSADAGKAGGDSVGGELLKQLSSRRLQYDSKARIQLEPKESMRSRGLSSPDRADAVIGAAVMALSGFTGGITLDTLAGTQFGRPQGGWAFFELEPVTF